MIRDVFVAVRRRIKFNCGEARSVAAAIRRHGSDPTAVRIVSGVAGGSLSPLPLFGEDGACKHLFCVFSDSNFMKNCIRRVVIVPILNRMTHEELEPQNSGSSCGLPSFIIISLSLSHRSRFTLSHQ